MTDDPGDGLGWPFSSTGTAGTGNAIRGFPPLPDEPLPVYPPGPFAAWNRGKEESQESARQAFDDYGSRRDSSHLVNAATITPDEFDTDYSLPAIKDPVPVYPGNGGSPTGRSGTKPGTGAGGPNRAAAVAAARASGGRAERHARGRPSRGRPGRAKSKHQSVWLAIGAAAVIVVAVIVVLVATSPGGGSTTAGNKATSPPRTTKSTPAAPPGKWEYIGSRATDPMPLSLRELFPASFYASSVYYHLTDERKGHNCRAALIGPALQTAVRKAGCSQELRASYASRVENAMATIGVFNLTDATAANLAATHAGRAQFVAQLSSKNGVTSKLGQGTGLEIAVVKGHYLVLVWAEFINLKSPRTNWQRSHLTSFMYTLIDSTINSSLSYRMVDGKPQTAAAAG